MRANSSTTTTCIRSSPVFILAEDARTASERANNASEKLTFFIISYFLVLGLGRESVPFRTAPRESFSVRASRPRRFGVREPCGVATSSVADIFRGARRSPVEGMDACGRRRCRVSFHVWFSRPPYLYTRYLWEIRSNFDCYKLRARRESLQVAG